MSNPNDTSKRLLSLDTESQKGKPLLIDILNSKYPENAIERLREYPNEARYVSDDGTTALHRVLEKDERGARLYTLRMKRQDRDEVVKLLLAAAPALAWSRSNKNGKTPLEMAFCDGDYWMSNERASFSIIADLIEAFEMRREDELFLIGKNSLLAHALTNRLDCTETIALLMTKPYCRGSEEMRTRHPQKYLHKLLDRRTFGRDDEEAYEVVRKIINSHPESVKLRGSSVYYATEGPRATKSLPIHIAVQAVHPSLPLILEALIAAEPWTVLEKDGSGFTPFELISFGLYSSWNELRHGILPLLRAIYLGCDGRTNLRRWREVHAILSVACPASVALEVMQLNPDQMREINEDGNLPLHLAASSIAFNERYFEEFISTCFDGWDENLKQKLHQEPVTFKELMEDAMGDIAIDIESPSPLRYALDANPNGAKVLNERGDLALHIAVEHDVMFDEGVENLIVAEPRALTSRNLESRMFPFMLAALEKADQQNTNSFRKANIIRKHAMWEKSRLLYGKRVKASKVDEYASHIIGAFVDLPNLTTIYQLIRSNPEPISCGIPAE